MTLLSTTARGCILLTVLLSGCSQWSSTPWRLQADYGASVNRMRLAQTLNPDRATHPDQRLPEGMEGNKADKILENVYRQNLGAPDQIGKHLIVGPGVGGTSGGGSGAVR